MSGFLGWLLRSLENPRGSLADPDEWLSESLSGGRSASGVRINRETALTYSAVWRAVSLVARTVAKLPICVYRNLGEQGKEKDYSHPAHWVLGKVPNSAMTPFIFKQTLQSALLLEGNAYAYILRKGDGTPIELWPLTPDPNKTYPVRQDGRLWYVTQVDNEMHRIDPSDIIHLKGLGFDGLVGYSVLTKAKESFGLGLAMQAYGSIYFRNSARPSVILQHPGRLSQEAAIRLRHSWESMHSGLDNSHRTAVLEEGMQAKEVTINARDSQLIESRQFSIRDVANWFNLPPHKLGDHSATSYKSLEQENQSVLDDSVDPWLVTWEEECEAKLLTFRQQERETHCISFDRFPLVRADLSQRGAFYAQALSAGWMSRDEVRSRENLNPIPGGEGSRYFVPLNLGVTGADPDGVEGGAVAPGAELLDVADLRQEADFDCGPAVSQAVCDYWGVGLADRAAYIEALGTTASAGTTPAAIAALLSRQGLVTTSAANLDVADLARFFANGQPVICPIQEAASPASGHYVIVIGTGLGLVFVHDPLPLAGRRMIAEADWLAIWRGVDANGQAYNRYAIAAGTELLVETDAPDPAASDAQDPADPNPLGGAADDSPPADSADRSAPVAPLLEALRRTALDTLARILRRLGTHARRASQRPREFLTWLDSLPGDHGAVVAQMLLHGSSALFASRGEAVDAQPLADTLLAEVRARLLDASGRATAAQLGNQIAHTMSELEQNPSSLAVFATIMGEK